MTFVSSLLQSNGRSSGDGHEAGRVSDGMPGAPAHSSAPLAAFGICTAHVVRPSLPFSGKREPTAALPAFAMGTLPRGWELPSPLVDCALAHCLVGALG